MAKEEEFEEWDKDFWDQVIEVEELVKSSSSTAAFPNPSQQQPLLLLPPLSSTTFTSSKNSSLAVASSSSSSHYHHPLSYSPPRELSQRIAGFGDPLPRSSNGIANCAPSLASAPTVLRSEIDKELEIERLKVRIVL